MVVDEIYKIKQNMFFYGMLYSRLFTKETLIFGFSVAIKSNYFRNFLEIY